MKRLFVIFGLIAVVIGLAVAQRVFLNNCCEAVLQSLDHLEQSCRNEEFEKAALQAKEIEDNWVGYEKKLSYFIDNTELSEVGMALSGISDMAAEGTKEEFLSHIAVIRVQFVHLQASNNVTFESVF